MSAPLFISNVFQINTENSYQVVIFVRLLRLPPLTISTMLNSNIPQTYKALVYDKPGEISTKVVELETPEPGPGEVLLRLYVRPYIRF